MIEEINPESEHSVSQDSMQKPLMQKQNIVSFFPFVHVEFYLLAA